MASSPEQRARDDAGRTARDDVPPSSHRAGDVLDRRYRLLRRLGHGGFGDVWEAEEHLPDGAALRKVALKLLLAGTESAGDWAEEAKLLASFRHPSLVTIYAAGILDGDPPQRFVAMELLEGRSLGDVLKDRGTVPWRRVLQWAYSAAAALDVIHAAGVVHLDLKPANLFLCDDGALKVLDFGIARRAGVASILPRRGDRLPPTATAREAELATGLFVTAVSPAVPDEDDALAATRPQSMGGEQRVVIGTPGFMAPEVLDLGEPTAAADAYALAVCVVQLVTGHLPHAAPDEPSTWEDPTAVSAWLDAIRRATLAGSLRSFDEEGARVPRGLAALLRRLLAVDPAQRGVASGKLGALFEEAWERPFGVPDPPYVGLAPFPPSAEGLLFGRDDDTARLGRELLHEPAVVLQGAPRVGKSSLAAVGLVPYLARRGADGKDDWVVVSVVPGDAPDAALDAALAAVSPDLAGAGVDAVAAFCARSAVGIALLVDPLEDAAAAPPEARARLEAMSSAIAAGPLRRGLRLVATLGEDATAALLATSLGQGLRAALRYVGPPSTAAVKDIVAGPAHFAGVPVYGVEPVAADVQRELRAGASRLPYVALALEAWWRSREPGRSIPPPASDRITPPPSNALRGEAWTASGGVRGAVVRHAERVMLDLDVEERSIAEELLLRLSATDGTPLACAEDELVASASGHAGGALAARVLAHLCQAHLVVVRRGMVEIGHEALLVSFPRLTAARLAYMDRLVFLERLREARIAWERADNHEDFLLHGARYAEVQAHRAWMDRGLTTADRAFVRESRRRARLVAFARAAVALALVLVVAGGALLKHRLDAAEQAELRARAAAVELEQLAELAARARRTDDPYARTAFAAAAMDRGSPDAMLPLEIAAAAENLARADVLSLDPVDAPSFPWDDRWLVGIASATTLAVVDFRPPEPDVIEDVDLDFDPDAPDPALHFKKPVLTRLRPFDDAVVERVPFAFDTAFAARSSAGEVKVFRLREDGTVKLAAVAPMRCAGAMRAAAAAPVIACASEDGVARWDLRRAREGAAAVDRIPFPGNVADVSADGGRVAAVAGRRVIVWSAGASGPPAEMAATRPVTLARFGPRDGALALVEDGTIEIVDPIRPGSPLVTLSHDQTLPELVRWDEGGLDVAVCGRDGGRWYYLKRGGRAKDDPPPRGDPCAPPRPKGQPEPIRTIADYADLVELGTGQHLILGGFKLKRRRYLTRDMIVFDASYGLPPTAPPGARARAAAARMLRFEGKDDIGGDEDVAPGDSMVAVERDEGIVAVQIGGEIRLYELPEGNRVLARPGHLLRRCADGRLVAWTAEGDRYRVVDVVIGAELGAVPREPGFVVGADSACRVIYTQRLDGALVEEPLAGGEARVIGRADGYVVDARPSAARGGEAAGILLAFGSGAVARIDEPGRPGAGASTLRVLGYATPWATAIADGPRPGETAIADATGVVLLRRGEAPVWLREGGGAAAWEDLSAAPDGESMLLASADRIAVLDVARREIVGSIPADGKGRLSRWDDDGSVLAWSFARTGGAAGTVIPRGVALAKRVAESVSNLDVEKGRLSLRR
jgi:serine/threonine protein kinase